MSKGKLGWGTVMGKDRFCKFHFSSFFPFCRTLALLRRFGCI